eukprot:7669658-Ditylum_brightwellii.AAC.1
MEPTQSSLLLFFSEGMLTKKYFNDDLINLAQDYANPDEEIKPSMINLPNTPCCFNFEKVEGKLTLFRSGYDDFIELLHNLVWKTSLFLLSQYSDTNKVKWLLVAMEQYKDPIIYNLDYFHPMALAAQLTNADTHNLIQAYKGSTSGGV